MEKYSIDDPADVDGDCIDDITELANAASMNPVNPAVNLELPDRFATIPDRETFETLALAGSDGVWRAKFVLNDMDTGQPSVYFQNTNNFRQHLSFPGDREGRQAGRLTIRGVISYNLELVAPTAAMGSTTTPF